MAAGCLLPLLDTAIKDMRARAQVIRVTVWVTGAGDGCLLYEDSELKNGEIHEQTHTTVGCCYHGYPHARYEFARQCRLILVIIPSVLCNIYLITFII